MPWLECGSQRTSVQLHFSLSAFTGFLGTDLGGRRESAGPSHCSTDSTSLTTVSSPKPRREPGKNEVPVGTDAVSAQVTGPWGQGKEL